MADTYVPDAHAPDGIADVTGVSAEREYVPLLANVEHRTACNMAQDYSSLAWSAVLVKRARTGQITDTYVNGQRQPANA